MSMGDKIAELRKKSGLTQNDLGKEMNVSYQAVSKWERGESQPDFETISKMAKYFDVPINYFEENDDAPVAQPYAGQSEQKNLLGTCTECGKVVYKGEEGETSPKLICKACVNARRRENEMREENNRLSKKRELKDKLGVKWGVKITVASIVAVALYIIFTVITLSDKQDADLLAALTAFIPMCGFGIVFSFSDFISDLRCKDGEEYCLATSLITAAAFAVINVIIFAVFYASLGQNVIHIVLLFVGAIISFAFVSQFMWGGVIGEIFSAGGFTYKLPGFIFGLTVESIIWMIITKILLTIVAAIVYIVTTVVIGFAALVAAPVLFIPSLLCKIRNRAKIKQELKAL